MCELKNENYLLKIKNGAICDFYSNKDNKKINLAGNLNTLGTVTFTLNKDDINNQEDCPNFCAYKDRTSKGKITNISTDKIKLYDDEYKINTTISIDSGLTIEAFTDNDNISQFGINIEFCFLGKKGNKFTDEILPSSPYITENKKYSYCIMNKIFGGFIVCVVKEKSDGWKIEYSSDYWGHYIKKFQFLSSFDKTYNGSNKKKITVYIKSAETLKESYNIIHSIYNVPYFRCIAGGNFLSEPVIEVSDDTDSIIIISPDNKKRIIDIKNNRIVKIPVYEYGFYKITPQKGDTDGISGCVWYGKSMINLFDLTTKAIKSPYHGDDNLCEGGCFLWDMLVNMNLRNNRNFDDIIKEELAIITYKNSKNIKRRTILPYKTDSFEPYHISDSTRIQEQFFGISILMEAYKVYKDNKYLEYAVNALNELCDNWITQDGMITNGSDYTTVCAPVIPIVDMANILSNLHDKRSKRFYYTAVLVADYLVKRDFDFPTEGTGEDNESDAEDGSVSCTALSVLYVCKNLKYDEKYIDFAKKVLKLHNAWRIDAPDAKLNSSSLRWWETIWEGDADGPAICAGHAWTIWRAESLYLYGILAYDDNAIIDSWNGYISNFSKTTKDGEMYSCYIPDFISGCGCSDVKKDLDTFKNKDISKKYKVIHGYPDLKDNSLSRYVWIRNAYSWYETAAVLKKENTVFSLNSKIKNDILTADDNIKNIYVGNNIEKLTINTKNKIKIISKNDFDIKCGKIIKNEIHPKNDNIEIYFYTEKHK